MSRHRPPHPHPSLAYMLWPTLTADPNPDTTLITDNHGRLAVLPLRPLTPHQLHYACRMHRNLNRGLLIIP
jgi:hypothetical protein